MSAQTADVIVIGGGIVGAAATYYLVKAGVDVILLERNIIADGTTGSSGGSLSLQDKEPGITLNMALESLLLYRNLEQELDHSFGYRECGGLVPIESEEELARMRSHIAPLVDSGVAIAIHPKRDLLGIEPEMGKTIIAASFCPAECQADPVRIALAYIWAAKRLGAKVMTLAEVQSLHVHRDNSITVITESNTITAAFVVNAAGVWASGLAAKVGIKIPLLPRQGQVAVLEPTSRIINTVILAAQYFDVKFESEAAQGIHKEWGIALTLDQRGPYVLIGSSRRFVGMDRTPDDPVIGALLNEAARMFPKLSKLRTISKIACLRPYTPDYKPIIGAHPEVPSFIFATGHEGDGICLAPITGQLVSQIVTDGRTSIAIEELSPARFSNNGAIRS